MVRNEISCMIRLHNPHIIQLDEVIDDPKASKKYLIMEFLPKKSILEFINQEGKPSMETIRKWA
jgi:serine/threonine protein kinase